LDEKKKERWTVEEDKVLANIILTFVRDGKTQLQAFVEAANVIGRSRQACAFRWNKTLRKQYNFHKLDQSKTNEVQDHLQEAMTTYNKLSKAYENLKLEYDHLQSEHQKIRSWFISGKGLFRID